MNLEQFKAEQKEAAAKVVTADGFGQATLIGGCDQAFFGTKIVSVVVVLDSNLNLVDKASHIEDVQLPYIPGYLFFREGPAVMSAYNKLATKPDVLMVDENGILHPQRCGMASHIGVALGIPTIGVAKNKLLGTVEGGMVTVDGSILGAEVRTRDYSKPLYVSPGHKVSLTTSIELVKRSIRYPHKLPEPLHMAHRLAEALKDAQPKD